MTAETIDQLIHQVPFRPYRLVLEDWEEIVVSRRRKSHVSGGYVTLVGISRLPQGETRVDKFRIVPVGKIVSAEQLAEAT